MALLAATLAALAAAALWLYRTSRDFSRDPLSDAPVRRVTTALPPIAVLLIGCLVTLALRANGGVERNVLGGGGAPVLMLCLVLLYAGSGVSVAVQGFALGERRKRRGDEEAARRLAARALLAVVVGGGAATLSIFASLVLVAALAGE